MKVKFELENMNEVMDLTSGKIYDAEPNKDKGGMLISDDSGVGITIVTEQCGPSSCAHLDGRALWQIVVEIS